ncbi:MAG: cytochrome c3 family protein [Thermoanaerobaculia bacterium]|nr:MAG: cytochrome c3 family protein [Thermoanaerobaculia bacterium]
MRLRRLLPLPFPLAALAAGALVSGPLPAADPPHWTGAALDIDCTRQCHTLHSSPGGQLTAAAGNVNLCQSCHSATGLASDLPVNSTDKAIPGQSGSSHAFDAPATNAAYGALPPEHAQMVLRVMDGNIVCSTCHNQHTASAANGGTPRISPARRVTALGSTGTVTSGGVFSGADGLWYLVEIQTAGPLGSARFRWSKDNGISWMAQNVLTAASNALDNGVTIAFSAAGSFALGERWEISASWPFLRAAIDSGDNSTGDKFCRDCHRGWVMDHTAVRTYDGTPRSHPIGVALNANGEGYDRAAPLDGNGAAQGGAGIDANASNDLRLDAGGRVQCLTCHGVHNVDSNTVTEDLR